MGSPDQAQIGKTFRKNQPDVCLNWQAEFESRVWTARLKD